MWWWWWYHDDENANPDHVSFIKYTISPLDFRDSAHFVYLINCDNIKDPDN